MKVDVKFILSLLCANRGNGGVVVRPFPGLVFSGSCFLPTIYLLMMHISAVLSKVVYFALRLGIRQTRNVSQHTRNF